MRVSIAGLDVSITGVDTSTGDWARRITAGLPAPSGPHDHLRIEFRRGVRSTGRALPPINLGATRQGIWVADHLDRAAWIPFHNLGHEPVVVDANMDERFFSNWVFHPLIRAALWKNGAGLYRGAAADVDDRRVAITAWTATGKSRILFELLKRGHGYIADDWMSLAGNGTVSAISSQLDVRDDQRDYVDDANWPGKRSIVRPRVVKAARWASKVTRSRRNLSTGLEHLAQVAWKAGWTKSDLATVFPNAPVASPGPLDLLVVLGDPARDLPSEDLVPEVMAACVAGEYGFLEMEAAYRFAHPGKLREPLFPRFETNRDFAAQALTDTRIVVVPFHGSPNDIQAIASMIESLSTGMKDLESGAA